MSQPLLPAPDDDAENRRRDDGEPRHDEQQHSRAGDNDRQQRIPSENECLAGLSRLTELLLARFVTPAQANAIRANLTTILQHHRQQRATHDRGGVADQDALAEQLARQPELANLLEPLLSKELIAAIMARARKDSHGV